MKSRLICILSAAAILYGCGFSGAYGGNIPAGMSSAGQIMLASDPSGPAAIHSSSVSSTAEQSSAAKFYSSAAELSIPVSSGGSAIAAASSAVSNGEKEKYPITFQIRDPKGRPLINANVSLSQYTDHGLESVFQSDFSKTKSNGIFMLPGLFESGAYQARVTLRSDYGQAIAEAFDILLPGDDMGVFNLSLKSRIESPPEEERPTHVNLVVKDEAGNPIPDLWLFVTDEPVILEDGSIPSIGGPAYNYWGFTDQNGTLIRWNADVWNTNTIPLKSTCEVYKGVEPVDISSMEKFKMGKFGYEIPDLGTKIGEFYYEVPDFDHSYEYTFVVSGYTID